MKPSESGEIPLDNSIFFHEGIIVKDKYKIHFNDAAQISLWKFIAPILDELKKKMIDHHNDNITEVTDEIVQETLHSGVIEKHKWIVIRFLERFTKKRAKEVLEKTEEWVKKDPPPIILQHIPIHYISDDGSIQIFPIELILRPDDTVKNILRSLWVRAKSKSGL